MLIGVDGNEANVEKKVGISEYSFELLKQFYKIRNSKHEIRNKFKIQNSKFKIYLKDQPRVELPKEDVDWTYRVIGPKRFWTQFALPFDLYFHRPRPDVFFSPTHYAPRFSPVPVTISIMDLSYIYYPEMFKASDLYQLRNWTDYSVKKARKVLTISQASKDDIIKTYHVPEHKVVVTYPGVKVSSIKRQASSMDKIRKKYGISGKYILFVGTLQPRKNLVRLIHAHSILLSKYPNISLVIVGKKGWLYEEILEAPKKFGIEDKVKFLDFVQDEDLQSLYKNAICFVLPSLYEGFGLPILEAMVNGCPVITSNISSLPEASGDAALYVDPENISDIAKNLELIINNSQLRKGLIEKGYKQVKKFSWEKTARETLKVLQEVAQND